MRYPTIDLQRRVLGNGGRVPAGLWPNNYWRGRRGVPPHGFDPMARLVAMLREMYRDLTNINVRSPSHVAPPFRSQGFLFQVNLTSNLTGTVEINGNEAVPVGSNGVLTQVAFTVIGDSGASVAIEDPWSASLSSRITIAVNGNAVPGYSGIFPNTWQKSHTVDTSGLGTFYSALIGGFPVPPLPPIVLNQGDSVTYSVAAGTSTQMLFYLQVSGYTYPIEVDADGVRGTLADRG